MIFIFILIQLSVDDRHLLIINFMYAFHCVRTGFLYSFVHMCCHVDLICMLLIRKLLHSIDILQKLLVYHFDLILLFLICRPLKHHIFAFKDFDSASFRGNTFIIAPYNLFVLLMLFVKNIHLLLKQVDRRQNFIVQLP